MQDLTMQQVEMKELSLEDIKMVAGGINRGGKIGSIVKIGIGWCGTPIPGQEQEITGSNQTLTFQNGLDNFDDFFGIETPY